MVHCKMYLCVLLLFVVLQLVASWPAAAFIGDPPQFSGDCYGLKGRLPGERCAPRPPPPPAPPVRPASVDALNKKKRYPMHLDPLYQYRLLARSGRKCFIDYIISNNNNNNNMCFLFYLKIISTK